MEIAIYWVLLCQIPGCVFEKNYSIRSHYKSYEAHIIIPVFSRRENCGREVYLMTQGHTARKWWQWWWGNLWQTCALDPLVYLPSITRSLPWILLPPQCAELQTLGCSGDWSLWSCPAVHPGWGRQSPSPDPGRGSCLPRDLLLHFHLGLSLVHVLGIQVPSDEELTH